MKLAIQVGDSIVTRPTSCQCGGSIAFFLKRNDNTEVSIGCICCTRINIDFEKQEKVRAYGKIIVDHKFITSPTYEGSTSYCEQVIAAWFNTHKVDAKTPWAMYNKPMLGGSYELMLEANNGNHILYHHGLANIPDAPWS